MNYSKSAFRVPGYLPYATPVERPADPVPNQAQCFWPQGRFAPEFLPPGSSSAQPFSYPAFPPSDVLYGNPEEASSEESWKQKAKDYWENWPTGHKIGFFVGVSSLALFFYFKPWKKKPGDYDAWAE